MMRTFTSRSIGWLAAGLAANLVLANSAPVVSNVTASQRGDGSNLVDIYYNLADADGDACTVWTAGSLDGGVTWTLAMLTLSGDVGAGVTPGTGKHIVWDGGANAPGTFGNVRIRVYADDGHLPPDMVLVYGGPFPYQGSQWTDVPTFYIDKYEVTNSQYCTFLNEADPNGDHWAAGMEIVRNGDAGSYSYGVVPGKENYPIRYVSYYDAEAFASWRSTRDGVTYALPSGPQWEKAAAWDPLETHYYTYGFHQDTIDSSWCNFNFNVGAPTRVGWYNGTGGRQDAEGYYGCYDMSGNLWEWTSEAVGGNRVHRGGSWTNAAVNVQCDYRSPRSPSERIPDNGFRLVLDPN
jgi:sulfatase modifying factor 1